MVRDGPGRCFREEPGVRGSDGDRIPQQKSASATQQRAHYTRIALTHVTEPEEKSHLQQPSESFGSLFIVYATKVLIDNGINYFMHHTSNIHQHKLCL
jgi:hypothetical protein